MHTVFRESLPLIEDEPIEQIFLDERDKSWVIALGGEWPYKSEEPEWLIGMNLLIRAGETAISKTVKKPTTDQYILRTRELFLQQFKVLHPAISQLQERDRSQRLAPLPTIVKTLRYLQGENIDLSHCIPKEPQLLVLDADSLKAKIEVLQTNGLDAPAVVNKAPSILNRNPETINQTIQYLCGQGFNVQKIIKKSPALLTYSINSLGEKIENLQQLGLDHKRVIDQNPTVISLSPQTIRERIESIGQLKLNATSLINRVPVILAYAPDSLSRKVRSLRAIGRLWKMPEAQVLELIEAWPQILTYRPGRLRTLARVANHTLDTKHEINTPGIRRIVMHNLEAVMVGYLEEGSIFTRKLGEPALRKLINQYPDDPVVKAYHKG
jgi:hypothetical protein